MWGTPGASSRPGLRTHPLPRWPPSGTQLQPHVPTAFADNFLSLWKHFLEEQQKQFLNWHVALVANWSYVKVPLLSTINLKRRKRKSITFSFIFLCWSTWAMTYRSSRLQAKTGLRNWVNVLLVPMERKLRPVVWAAFHLVLPKAVVTSSRESWSTCENIKTPAFRVAHNKEIS